MQQLTQFQPEHKSLNPYCVLIRWQTKTVHSEWKSKPKDEFSQHEKSKVWFQYSQELN